MEVGVVVIVMVVTVVVCAVMLVVARIMCRRHRMRTKYVRGGWSQYT
jgi:hypothetical protein